MSHSKLSNPISSNCSTFCLQTHSQSSFDTCGAVGSFRTKLTLTSAMAQYSLASPLAESSSKCAIRRQFTIFLLGDWISCDRPKITVSPPDQPFTREANTPQSCSKFTVLVSPLLILRT